MSQNPKHYNNITSPATDSEATAAHTFSDSYADIPYKDIVDVTGSFIVRWDAVSNKIIFCNKPYAERWGSTEEKIIGSSIYDLREPAARESLQQYLSKIKPGETTTGVYTVKVADGSIRSARVFTRAIANDGVNIVEYQSNGYDCTEEQAYRDALDKLFAVFSSEYLNIQEKLEQLLEIGLNYYQLDTAIVSMIVGDDYEIKSVSSRKQIQFEVGTVLHLSDTFSGQFVDKEALLAIDNVSASKLNTLPGYKRYGVESFIGASVHTASGPYGTVSFSSTVSRGNQYSAQDKKFSTLIGSWIGFLIGNQEQIEFMANQNEHYRTLFQTVPAMMFLCDADGLIISASDRLCVKLHKDSELLPGKNCHRVFNVNDKAGLEAAIVLGDADHLPLTFFLSDNSTIEVELDSSIKTVGTLQGVRMVVLSDVSERNKASRNAEEQNRLLKTANENLNQFAFIASHDLQEPLRKIQQFSSFLEEDLDGKLDKDASYHLNVIVDASNRMSTLIRDLLRFSGASQEEPQIESISLNELLAEVISGLQLPIEESKAVISVEKLPNVDGDRGMLRQLFVNLISNGIKYRSQDRPLTITVKGKSVNLQEGVSVSDNGIGFEMEFARKIFEPFNRLHRNNEYKGNGIGLAICGTVCDKHGWRLSAESEPDVGSTFVISFT